MKDPPLPQSTQGGAWISTLTPLLKHKSRWFLVKTFDRPSQSGEAQSNLTGRRVRIPEPSHDWSFAARGCELYAIYRGPFVKQHRNRR
jgi:hypothetical protein